MDKILPFCPQNVSVRDLRPLIKKLTFAVFFHMLKLPGQPIPGTGVPPFVGPTLGVPGAMLEEELSGQPLWPES